MLSAALHIALWKLGLGELLEKNKTKQTQTKTQKNLGWVVFWKFQF